MFYWGLHIVLMFAIQLFRISHFSKKNNPIFNKQSMLALSFCTVLNFSNGKSR